MVWERKRISEKKRITEEIKLENCEGRIMKEESRMQTSYNLRQKPKVRTECGKMGWQYKPGRIIMNNLKQDAAWQPI